MGDPANPVVARADAAASTRIRAPASMRRRNKGTNAGLEGEKPQNRKLNLDH
jgi:hypothetical protein